MAIERHKSCVIEVGLMPHLGGVGYEMNIGGLHLEGLFFGPRNLLMGMIPTLQALPKNHSKDFLITFGKLYPPQTVEENDYLSQLIHLFNG